MALQLIDFSLFFESPSLEVQRDPTLAVSKAQSKQAAQWCCKQQDKEEDVVLARRFLYR
jgi:hypothetical protein